MQFFNSSSRPRLPQSTYLLALAQAINLTAAVISVTIAAVIGTKLASTAALGTVPYGVQFAAVMMFTYPASMLMCRYGRRIIFCYGAIFLIVAGVVGYIAVTESNFILLIVAHGLLGIYIACANFYRFAAVDNLPSTIKSKGISLVVAGGVIAAIIGPVLASRLRSVIGYADFSLCYAALIGLGVVTLLIMANWHQDEIKLGVPGFESPSSSLVATNKWNLKIVAAIFTAAVGYFIMNLLMVQASLVMKNICSFDASSRAIQIHVLAMFVPSFLTGSLIAKKGLRYTLLLGFTLIVASAIFGMTPISYESVSISLLLLGLGWNLTYVGGGSLLAQCVSDRDRHRWQGINDSLIAGCATLGALIPAPLFSAIGWSNTNFLVLPLCFAGSILCWSTITIQQDQ